MTVDRSLRYDRQERLSLWDQKIIDESTILIAGVGGTGSEVVKNLALLGIGHLILVDVDTIEFSNLNRQMLFREEDVGREKAIIAKKRIKEHYNPDMKIECFTDLLQNIPLRIYEQADIIAGCVDNFLARQFLNSQAVELNIPLIDSATDGYFGQVQYVRPNLTACLACDNPIPPNETKIFTAPCTLVGKPRTKEQCAWKALYEFTKIHNREPKDSSKKDILILLESANKYAEEYDFGFFEKKEIIQIILFHIPSLITVNAVISGIQSQELIKALFLEKKNRMRKVEQKSFNSLLKHQRFRIPSLSIYSALTGTISTFDLTKDPDCLVCKQLKKGSKRIEKITVKSRSPFSELLDLMSRKNNKTYIGFRGNTVIPKNEIIQNILSDRDRITLSSLIDDEEIRLQIIFEKKR